MQVLLLPQDIAALSLSPSLIHLYPSGQQTGKLFIQSQLLKIPHLLPQKPTFTGEYKHVQLCVCVCVCVVGDA